MKSIRCLAAAAVLLAAHAVHAVHAATPGSYLRLFGATSVWNSRPVSPVLGTFAIPLSLYYPTVGEGAWSSGVFQALATDRPVTIVGPVGAAGVWDPDSEAYKPSITLPRWPASVIPASAADGHADVVDETAGVVHSFWQLRNDNGTWRAAQYAWSPLSGRGWGDLAHYYQGARATAVPTSAGLIRKHEVNDGDTQYRHVLAVSLTHNALAASPTYVFPATSADADAATANTGKVPEGSLLMLPPNFDTSKITTASLRKVAETLKTYGAFAVDRNTGTPFVIYVENGSGFRIHPPGGWNGTAANELQVIRAALRPVMSTSGWIDANGVTFKPSPKQNVLSMRGAWGRLSGTGTAAYDTWQQAVQLSAATAAGEFRNVGNRNIAAPAWGKPVAGQAFQFTASATGGAKLRLDLIDRATNKVVYTSGYLANGETRQFTWPVTNFNTVVYVTTVAGQAAKVSGNLVLR